MLSDPHGLNPAASLGPSRTAAVTSPSIARLKLVPAGLILLWWIHDLSFQWRSLVEYQYGWIVTTQLESTWLG